MRIDTRCLVQNSGSSVYVCSLVVGHAGQHEAWNGHKVEPLGERLFAWPQETKSGPSNVTTFAELRDLVIELEARETETRLRHAAEWKDISERLGALTATTASNTRVAAFERTTKTRLDAFEDRLQRLRDDTRDAAAAAGEALERTKGLQVPEILRRLSQTERRINLMDGGHAATSQSPTRPPMSITDAATLYDLKGAVNELTVVMRELVQQNTPPMTTSGSVRVSRVEPRTCPATLTKGVDELQTLSVCTRPPGHPGMHREGDEESWLAQS
jgi:hypothetical protein